MPSANAVVIAKIHSGEIDDITTDDGKNAAGLTLERMGGRRVGRTARSEKK
jgi:hypothetical protein